MNAEHQRLEENRRSPHAWEKVWWKWGPFLSERQWGTVREDYSQSGDAWTYLGHDAARSRAYRWGEDGLAGYCDDQQQLCHAIALWNGQDSILKERLFGLTNNEGNHGEDVKELYYYLDAVPSHAYLKMLYKYPQRAFPYDQLVAENGRRSKQEPEYELLDTGIFDDDRYFDVFVEYAKAGPRDVLMLATIHNRGPEDAPLDFLSQLWFRNTWTWKTDRRRPTIDAMSEYEARAQKEGFGRYHWYGEPDSRLIFCNNETNTPRLYHTPGEGPFKDGFNEYIVHGDASAIASTPAGTKAALHKKFIVPAGGSVEFRMRLSADPHSSPFNQFQAMIEHRRAEADEFYAAKQELLTNEDARLVQRQAFAGMIWSKQFYHFNVEEWLKGDPTQPAPAKARQKGRDSDWKHIDNSEVISMPDKWEYPWYAAWDLAFHCVAFAAVDPDFAKQQLTLLTREWYMHPNGQLPAYEWAFGDVNPPVHAWATWRVYQIERRHREEPGDIEFLERVFHKLLLNFTWWVNRKDAQGLNIFQGGFLGLDNIGVFDRSAPLPNGGHLNQADGTSWMAMYCLNMLRISLELAGRNRVYEGVATKFFEHFLNIAEALTNIGEEGIGLWDNEDEFYYDALVEPSGKIHPLKLRSMVGLIPLFAVEVIEPETINRLPEFSRRLKWVMENRPHLASLVSRWRDPGRGDRRLLSLLRGHRMKRLLARALDPNEFLSDYGIRALSKHHLANPFRFSCQGQCNDVQYTPGESDSGMFGGNSNWRGPIWFPVNYLIAESLYKFHTYYGDDFKIECPTGSGQFMTLLDAAKFVSHRLMKIFEKDEHGHRAVYRDNAKLQSDPHFRDYIHFYEYFHGDTGRGVGASHQTGWTGLIGKLYDDLARESGSGVI